MSSLREKKAKIVIRRLSESGQHAYLVLGSGAVHGDPAYGWDTDPKNAHRFESMVPAIQAAIQFDFQDEDNYDYVYMR